MVMVAHEEIAGDFNAVFNLSFGYN